MAGVRDTWRSIRASFTTDRIVSLSAMVVGVSSLFVIVYQTHLMRQAQSASALPYLMVGVQANGEGTYLTLSNTGLGPALIEHVRIRHGGRTYEEDPHDFFIRMRPDRNIGALSVDRIAVGRLIPAGSRLMTLGMDGDERLHMLVDLLNMFQLADVPNAWLVNHGVPLDATKRAAIEITYASVYGERWRITSDRLVPERQ
jgi:hypothetical protein